MKLMTKIVMYSVIVLLMDRLIVTMNYSFFSGEPLETP